MQKIFQFARSRRRHLFSNALLVGLLMGTVPAAAVEVKDLYSAEVAIDPADPESREAAYGRALQQVLVRITGSEDAAFSPELAALFPNPARFVLQYRPVADNGLWVALDGAAIEQVLRQRGLPVWSSERPLTMIWLLVDRGRGQRELLTAATNDPAARFDPDARAQGELRARVTRIATARGLPIVFPRQDDVDRANVNLSDIWGGFHDGLIAAARSRDIASVLVGRARPGDAERSRWSYYSGSQRQQWNGDIEDAMHLLADTLAGEFVITGNESLAVVELTISNVRSAANYAAVQRMMAETQVIDDYRMRAVNGDELRYAVRINGGARRLSAALSFRGEFVPLTDDPETGLPLQPNALHYAFRP
ncbi:MAG: DUF2066 domain-containing protein [Woeseia sp.]